MTSLPRGFEQLGPWRVAGELGRGASGMVLRAGLGDFAGAVADGERLLGTHADPRLAETVRVWRAQLARGAPAPP